MYRPFDNDVPQPQDLSVIKYVHSADKLSDEELMAALIKRGMVAAVSCEKQVPLKDTMYEPHERQARKEALQRELATSIGHKMLVNKAFTETVAVRPELGTHLQTYTLSAYICLPKVE